MNKIFKPWGYELIFAHTDRYVGKILHIDHGHALSKQYHRIKDETILIQTGTLTLEIDDRQLRLDFDKMEEDGYTLILEPGESFHIEAGLIHRMIAENGPVDIIEVSTPELTDVIRLEDKYGRV